jgi:hypothetical protein
MNRILIVQVRAITSVAVGVNRNLLLVDPVQVCTEGFVVDIREFYNPRGSLLPIILAGSFEECSMLD